jgi:hypothetical protein
MSLVEFTFRDEVQRANIMAVLTVLGRAPRRNKDRGDLAQHRIEPSALDKRKTIHARHLDIDEKDAIVATSRLFERLFCGNSEVNVVSSGLEDALLEHPGRERVVNDEDWQPRWHFS